MRRRQEPPLHKKFLPADAGTDGNQCEAGTAAVCPEAGSYPAGQGKSRPESGQFSGHGGRKEKKDSGIPEEQEHETQGKLEVNQAYFVRPIGHFYFRRFF